MGAVELEALVNNQKGPARLASRFLLDRAESLKDLAHEPFNPAEPASWRRKARFYGLVAVASYGLGLLLREGQEAMADYLQLPKTTWTWGNLAISAAIAAGDLGIIWQSFEQLDTKQVAMAVGAIPAAKLATNLASAAYRVPKALQGIPTPSYGGLLGPGAQAVQYAARNLKQFSERDTQGPV